MYKLGFLTLILCAVTSRQVICDDSGKCVASIVVCDNNCVASTVVCDNSNEIYDSNEIGGIDEIDDSGEIGGIDDSDDSDEIGEIGEIGEIDHSDNNCVTTTVVCVDNCVTSTIDSKATSTWDSRRESISSSGKINQVMYIFGLLPLVLL